MLQAGDRFPDFALADEAGQIHRADQLTGTVIVYFYPKDDTPGCTKQACAFRDAAAAYAERGARILGVSGDDQASHQAFKAKYRLSFPLLSDPDFALSRAAGVFGPQEFRGHRYEGIARTTFILRDGVVAEVFPDVNVMGHAERVLAAL